MADNAIDKLFEEIRATQKELDAIIDEREAHGEKDRILKQRHMEAIRRRDLLDATLKKHIYDDVPVVQAKMLAHEEMANRASLNAGWSTASTSTTINTPMGIAQQALSQANAQMASIAARYAKGY